MARVRTEFNAEDEPLTRADTFAFEGLPCAQPMRCKTSRVAGETTRAHHEALSPRSRRQARTSGQSKQEKKEWFEASSEDEVPPD